MKTIRTEVIGLGNMGTTHVRALQEGKVPGFRLEAVCESPALFHSGKVDAVAIATPHFSHTLEASCATSAATKASSSSFLQMPPIPACNRIERRTLKTLTPLLEDFGEANMISDNGASGHYRVDWLTPDGLSTWGDGRTLIVSVIRYFKLRLAN